MKHDNTEKFLSKIKFSGFVESRVDFHTTTIIMRAEAECVLSAVRSLLTYSEFMN